MKISTPHGRPPASILVWTLPDSVIEDPPLLEEQFHEIRRSGFGGVAPFVRCSRYTWNDPPARKTLRAIGVLCKKYRMEHWIGPDPRFVSRELITGGNGLEVLLFGDKARADVFPNFGTVTDGPFSVRCRLSPRHVHTLNEVAIEYTPIGLAGVFAVRQEHNAAFPAEVVDITPDSRFFYNARDRYVEAFGSFPSRETGNWRILAFFKALTNHVDYSNSRQMQTYMSMLTGLKKERCAADGVMWDEPGYTCTYGTLPFSPVIRREYLKHAGRSIETDLWKLALPAHDESHIPVRNTYYRVIQQSVNKANAATTRHMKRLWGKDVVSGIHDTWHFESADMCDMNHGSLDLWEAMKTKSGGFVDLGGIDQLRNPDSPWYAHLAAMSIICASLGRRSGGGYAYNNLWTVGDDNGEGWQTGVMGHCVDTMALFGTRWLAHAYGPVGTIGQERSFLDSPPLPGYPDHSTWPGFPEWNRRLAGHLEMVEHRLPEANLLVVFPVETLYALAGPAADDAAAGVFRLLLALLDTHYHVEVVSAALCRDGRFEKGAYVSGKRRFDAVLLPFPRVLHPDILPLLRRQMKNVLLFQGTPERMNNGRKVTVRPAESRPDIDGALLWLKDMPNLRPVEAPAGSWVSSTPVRAGTVITLAPSRYGYTYGGRLSRHAVSIDISRTSGLTRVLFPHEGGPVILKD